MSNWLDPSRLHPQKRQVGFASLQHTLFFMTKKKKKTKKTLIVEYNGYFSLYIYIILINIKLLFAFANTQFVLLYMHITFES